MIPFSPDEGDFGTFALFVIYMLLSFFALFLYSMRPFLETIFVGCLQRCAELLR